MKRQHLSIVFGLATALATAGPPQAAKPKQEAPRTLAAEIQAMKWDAAKSGPLLALDVAGTPSKSKEPGLAGFARKKMQVGELTVIAPTEMVLIDDRMDLPPNLYDGLPPDAKVLYLLTTLTPEQMNKAAGRGIGMADLVGEQRNVLRSLVPHPFKYISSRVNDQGIMSWPVEKKTLSESETSNVRIRISRGLDFHLFLRDQPRAYTMHSTSEEYGQPGDTAYARDEEADYDRGDSFGIQRRIAQVNKLKPSDINYEASSFAGQVDLPATTTVDKLLKQAGSACGVEIHADFRVGDLVVTSIGTKARAADILKAIALMVTGTYRKVGDVYVLTSDLVGMGSRKLTLSMFENDIRNSVYDKASEWRAALGKAGALNKFAFDSGDPLAPDDVIKKHLEQSDKGYESKPFSTAGISPSLKGFLARVNRRYSAQPVNTDEVDVQSYVQFSFVLPNGQSLQPERTELGSAINFVPPTSSQTREDPPIKRNKLSGEGAPIPLIVAIGSASEGDKSVETAKAFGFREIWVKTRSAKALASTVNAAKSSNIAVRFVIDPWDVSGEPKPADPDRTLLGETGNAATARLNASREYGRYNQYMQGEPIEMKEMIAPSNPGLSARWAAFADLARTPGISGIVLVGSEPGGYEPAVSRSIYGGFTKTLASLRLFGYTTAQRAAFIRAKNIDPVDIAWEGWMGMSDTRQPFFLDDAQRGGSSMYDGRDNPHAGMDTAMAEWSAFRAKANESAILALLRVLPSTPILIEVRNGTQNYPPLGTPAYVPWQPGAVLPTLPPEKGYLEAVPPGSFAAYQLPREWPLPPGTQRARTSSYIFSNLAMVQKQAASRGNFMAVDATRVSADKLTSMLSNWFLPLAAD